MNESRIRQSHAERLSRGRTVTLLLLAVEFVAVAGVVLIIGWALQFGTAAWAIAVPLGVAALGISWAMAGRQQLVAPGAQPADPDRHAELLHLVESVGLALGVPAPSVLVLADDAANACSFGRSRTRSFVLVTQGMLDLLSRRELEGVLAHEMCQVRDGDAQSDTFAATTVGAVTRGAELFTGLAAASNVESAATATSAAALLPVALASTVLAFGARLLSFAISRRRDLTADLGAAATVSPTGLRQALEKLELEDTAIGRLSRATAHLWVVAPLARFEQYRIDRNRWFDTHAPLQQRIHVLRELEGLDPDARGPLDPCPTPRDPVEHPHLHGIAPADAGPEFVIPAGW